MQLPVVASPAKPGLHSQVSLETEPAKGEVFTRHNFKWQQRQLSQLSQRYASDASDVSVEIVQEAWTESNAYVRTVLPPDLKPEGRVCKGHAGVHGMGVLPVA